LYNGYYYITCLKQGKAIHLFSKKKKPWSRRNYVWL
jgi:hypothetical protein